MNDPYGTLHASAITAIGRTRLSAPMGLLSKKGLLKGRVLDHGCGRGFDSKALGVEGWDPWWNPDPKPESGAYDTITSIYVLNTLRFQKDRNAVLADIRRLLKPDGTAYVAVRNDKGSLRGDTGKGTWQGLVELDAPLEAKTAGFAIYAIRGGLDVQEKRR